MSGCKEGTGISLCVEGAGAALVRWAVSLGSTELTSRAGSVPTAVLVLLLPIPGRAGRWEGAGDGSTKGGATPPVGCCSGRGPIGFGVKDASRLCTRWGAGWDGVGVGVSSRWLRAMSPAGG